MSLPLTVVQLSLDTVLRCGQSFRWSKVGNEYRLCLRDRVVCVSQDDQKLHYHSYPVTDDATRAWIEDYFRLSVDLHTLYTDWSTRDPVFKTLNLASRLPGVRILRQDPWETLIAFICSSNNNISRISKMVQNLCIHFSDPLLSLPDISGEPVAYHPFPKPEALAAPDVPSRLRSLGFGYRAEFIHRTAKMLVDLHGSKAEEWLASLRTQSTGNARAELLKLMGVGPKVADCILLMSMDKHEVIPVDTHVQQIAVKHYKFRPLSKSATMTPVLYSAIAESLAKRWGPYAGWAHSVLFTSDLSVFAQYDGSQAQTTVSLPTPPSTPNDRKTKRNRDEGPDTQSTVSSKKSRTSNPIQKTGSHLVAPGKRGKSRPKSTPVK